MMVESGVASQVAEQESRELFLEHLVSNIHWPEACRRHPPPPRQLKRLILARFELRHTVLRLASVSVYRLVAIRPV